MTTAMMDSKSTHNRDLYFEDVAIGIELPTRASVPTVLQLFRYSAVTWNAHRIHYDREYALREGHPDVLVQAHLHGAFLCQIVTDWLGPRGRLRSVEWSNRARAIPGDTLTCGGRVARTRVEAGECLVEIDLHEQNQRGEICATGHAVIALPLRGAR
jgi:hydroxyacyl-ACP dehydratase HTD2-like protein with hotdog domain